MSAVSGLQGFRACFSSFVGLSILGFCKASRNPETVLLISESVRLELRVENALLSSRTSCPPYKPYILKTLRKSGIAAISSENLAQQWSRQS